MLLGNYSVLAKSCGSFRSGTRVADARSNFGKAGAARNQGIAFGALASAPAGYAPGSAWLPARSGGGLASTTIIGGQAGSAANLAGGLNAEASIAGAGQLSSADLALIVSAVASIAGTGGLTAAIAGKLDAAASLAGQGDLAGSLGALADAVASLVGAGAITAGDLRALAGISADILPFTELSPESLAAAVWRTPAALANAAASMGEKLNDAGSASNPWTEVIESGYTAAEILRLLAAVMAGKSSGGGGAQISFRDLGDTKTRIAATVDQDGNRTALIHDAA